MKFLELKNINKYYDSNKNNRFHVLKDINISFKRGEFIAIIGESGSGKSTLMNLIGGLDSDYKGEIIVDGDNIDKYKKKQLDVYRKSKVGFIFQSFNLIPHLSVLDNVTIPMIINGVSKSNRIKKGKEILRKVGLERYINKKPNKLSGGQKQRVAIARALVNNPDIIIADEPTGSLDSQNTIQILKLIDEIVKEGKLVIMVTHSDKVASCADRIVEIKDGLIINDIKNKKNSENSESFVAADYEDSFNNGSLSSSNSVHKKIKKKNKNLNLLSSIKLALVNMKEKFLRNALISIGGSIGIMGVILMLGFGNGVKTYFNNTMNNYVNPMVIEVNMPEGDEAVEENYNPMEIPKLNSGVAFEEEDLQKLRGIENVINVEKGYNVISMGANSISGDNGGCNIIRLSTVSSVILQSSLSTGNIPSDGEILINKAVADKLGEDVVGKKVKLNLLIGDKKISNEFIVSGIYSASSGDFNSMLKSAFINYSDLEKIYTENNSQLKPNTAYITSSDEAYTNTIMEKAKEMGYSSSSQEQMTNLFNEMINIITYVLSGIAAISLIVSSIMILVVLYMSVIERVKEIGILKAVGARKKDIRRIFVSEAFLIGLFSGIAGCIISICIMILINKVSLNLFSVSLVIISRNYIIYGVVLSIIMSVIAGLIPAVKASRLDPIESLRRE